VLIIIALVSGLWLWWPKHGRFKAALKIKRHTSLSRQLYDLHKITGLVGFLVLLVVSFTGFSFAYSEKIEAAITQLSSIHTHRNKPPPGVMSQGSNTFIGIEEALAVAQQVFPNAQPRRVKTPTKTQGIYTVESRQSGEANYRSPRSRVFIDAHTGQVRATENPSEFTAGETFMNLLWPLHSGEALGLTGRIVWALAGLLPLTLWLSGLIRWRQKAHAADIGRELHRQPDQNQ